MKKNLLLLVAVMTISYLMYGGVYRHDVPAEQYKKLVRAKQFDCVGMILTGCGENNHGGCVYRGSCVLIGKKYVLCAAHLLTKVDIKLDTFYYDKNHKAADSLVKGGSMMVVNQPIAERSDDVNNFSFRFKDRLYYAKKWQIYPAYLDSVNATPRVDFCGDLVLVELEDTVAGVGPATLSETFDEQGAIITGVGYGSSGRADRPEDIGEYCEKIAGQNVIDSIFGPEINGKPGILMADFDSPDGREKNCSGSAKPLPLEWSPGGGDCGGGIFRQIHGSWQLIGIVAGGPGSGYDPQFTRTSCYGGVAGYVRTSVFIGWIRKTIEGFGMEEMEVDEQKNK